MEAGQRLLKRNVVSQAVTFFQRAVELQHQTRECRLETLNELVKCYIYLSEFYFSDFPSYMYLLLAILPMDAIYTLHPPSLGTA